jgi:hypothetical protein
VDLGFDLAEDLSNTQDLELLQCFSSLQGPWALTLSLDLAPQANTALSSLQELLLMPQQPIEARLLGWIAARLPRLQSLNAAVAGADSSSCLRALSRHPELRCLELQGRLGFDVGVAQLTQLAALTQLTYLWLRPLSCSAAAERRFLAGMPRLRKIGTEQPRQPWH